MDGLLESFIPLISKKDRSNSTPNLGHQTNTLPLAHLHMKRGWHPAPVHSFTLPLWFGGLYDEQRAAQRAEKAALEALGANILAGRGG